MQKQSPLGEFEQLILLAILRLGPDAYGVPIAAEILTCAGRQTSAGALYTQLDRMQGKALVTSHFSNPTPERGGRAKRYFQLTDSGRQALIRAQQAYQTMLTGLNLLPDS